MGGFMNGSPTTDVLFLDSRTHTWRPVPSMRVARASAAAAVVEGKIYIIGGCSYITGREEKSLNWGEAFDPMTQTWELLPPMSFPKSDYIHDCVVRDRKVYAVHGKGRSIYYSFQILSTLVPDLRINLIKESKTWQFYFQELWSEHSALLGRDGGEYSADLVCRDFLGEGQRGNIEWSHVVMTIDVDPFYDRYKILYSVSITL